MFDKYEGWYCVLRLEQHFDTLTEAQSACVSSNNCGGVYDPYCDRENYPRHANSFGLCDKKSGKRYSKFACIYYRL